MKNAVPTVVIGTPSSKSAKLHTVAASYNRDDARRSLYYCLFTPLRHGSYIRAHPVRGELHIQRHANQEVATIPRNSLVSSTKEQQ